jgi:hypothetical protein
MSKLEIFLTIYAIGSTLGLWLFCQIAYMHGEEYEEKFNNLRNK